MNILKPMDTAPLVPILALHMERGPVEISPAHEANYWLSCRNWFLIDDPEAGLFDNADFDGWIAECAQ